jgi:hypothetical protein
MRFVWTLMRVQTAFLVAPANSAQAICVDSDLACRVKKFEKSATLDGEQLRQKSRFLQQDDQQTP